MKNNRGSALFITAVLMFALALLTILAFSFFYLKFNRSKREYQFMKERIEAEVVAQNVIVHLNDLVLEKADFVITIKETDYEIKYDDETKTYEYQIYQEFVKQKINVLVNFDEELTILVWNVWSE
jgi:hypothetical protein